ncbi:MAG: MATE family efflux transporter [Myxococcota bacterium]
MTPADSDPRRRLSGWLHRDHTRGNLVTSMWVLALPLLASNVLGGLVFQVVDLGFLSRLGEEAVTAVIVTNQSLRQVLFMLVMGASFGAQALIARSVGSGRPGEADHIAGQVVVLGFAASAVFAVLGTVFAPEMLATMRVAPEVLEIGVPYVRLSFALNFGFVFLFLFNAILNGAGDATTPLLVAVVQTAVGLLGEWVFIFGNWGAPALGIQGVAWGVACGHVVAGAIAVSMLFRGTSRVHLRLRHFAPDAAVLRRLVALSWPPAIQLLSAFVVNVIFIRLMGELSSNAQAAYSIGLRISMMGPMLAFPLAGAAATLVGQNLGAGRIRRAWQSIGLGLAVNLGLLWSIGAGMALFRREIMALLASDPEVIAIGSEMLLFQAAAFALWAFYFVCFRSLQGAGQVAVPMVASILTAVFVSLPTGLLLSGPLGWGHTGIFAATVVGSAVNTLVTGGWIVSGRWARRTAPSAAPGPEPT